MTKETEVTLGVTVKANKGSWGTIDDLLLTREGVDKTKLGTALSSAKEKLAETMHYTKDSLANLKEQVEEAQAILQKDDATQAEIDAECEALQTAIQALVPLENQSSSNVQHEDGKKIKQYVSQATLVDELIPMISNTVVQDNEAIKNGEAIQNPNNEKLILRKYFYDNNLYDIQAKLIGFYNAWIEKIQKQFKEDTIVFKTVGFIASLFVFRSLSSRLESEEQILDYSFANSSMSNEDSYIDGELINKYKIQFMELIEELSFDSIDINSISSSRSGATKLYNLLTKI